MFRTLFALLLCLTLVACDSAEEKAQAYYERGMELLAEGDIDRARLEFRNALREVNTMLEPRLELARLHVKAGALRPAFRDYLRIVEQYPDNVEANIALGQLTFQVKDWENFELYSAKAVELAPEDPDVRILELARRYKTAADEDDAPARSALVAEAEKLAPDSPDNDILRQILIDGYLADSRFSDALDQLDQAIAAQQDDIQLYMLKLQILDQIGEEDAIEEQLREMAARFPDETTVQANLLRYLISRDKADEAEAFLRDKVSAAPEDDANHFVTLIQFLLRLRGEEAAMAELNDALEARPNAHALHALRASLRFDAGERTAAISEMQEIVDKADKGETDLSQEEIENIKVTLANMLSSNGNEVGARRLVEEILQKNPGVTGALKLQARWMIADDDTDGAVTAMRTALASSPQDAEAMTLMAEAHQRAGNKELMLDFLSQAAEAANNAPEQALRYAAALRAEDKLLQAESALITSLRAQSNNIDVLAALGQIYLDLEDLGRTRQVADTLKRIENQEARAIAANLEVELLSREGGNAQVMAYLQELANDSDGNAAKIALVQAHMQNDETEEALALINQLIEEDPENLVFVFFRGLVEGMRGDYETATQTFTELTAANPDADLGWIQLARLQTVENDSELVLGTLDEALSHNPDSPDLLGAKASYLQEQNDIDGAIAIYEQLYEQYSGSLVIANNLASLITTFRDDEESLERARVIARRLKGTDVPALQDTYGWILFRTGNAEEALKYLEPAAKGLPGDASVQFHLGEVYNALGRREEALAQMRLAVEKIGPLGSGALSSSINARIEELEASAGVGAEPGNEAETETYAPAEN